MSIHCSRQWVRQWRVASIIKARLASRRPYIAVLVQNRPILKPSDDSRVVELKVLAVIRRRGLCTHTVQEECVVQKEALSQ